MATFLYKTRGNSSPEHKPRVFFTCHLDDFEKYFDKICKDIFKLHDCVVFYTEDLNEEIEDKYMESDLGQMNLFVIPVTFKLLSKPNRAMDSDFRYAKEKNIPVLPIMMEPGLDTIYSQNDKFGELQYLDPYAHDLTAISYEEKLKKYLESVLISNEMAERVRKAFDAYIFLSYRKKDRHYANELMKMIHRHPEYRDIAIWYDEFLTPGESFCENIKRMIKNSKLFTLLVTPNLLEYVDGKPNYVMKHEYPNAKKAGMNILPTEMEETDRDALRSKFDGIPDCVRPNEDEVFKKRLADTLSKIAISENNDDPEHNFLIGLAYLEGIDVETNRERGVSLINSAAEDGLIEAMKKLFDMYSEGTHIRANLEKAIVWGNRTAEYYRRHEEKESENLLTVLTDMAVLYGKAGEIEKALELLEYVYNCERRNRGEANTYTLHALNNLAFAYGKHGEYEKALKMHKGSYKLHCDILGEKDRSTLLSLNNLAMTYVDIAGMDNYEKALELNKKVYAIRKEILGARDYDTLISLNNIAYTYSKLKKYDKAMEAYKKLHGLCLDKYGECSKLTITALNGIAEVYADTKMYGEEIEARKKICVISKEMFSVGSFAYVVSIHNLAFAYEEKGDSENYIITLEELHSICSSEFGESNEVTLQVLLFMAVAYQKYGYEEKLREAKEKIIKYNA